MIFMLSQLSQWYLSIWTRPGGFKIKCLSISYTIVWNNFRIQDKWKKILSKKLKIYLSLCETLSLCLCVTVYNYKVCVSECLCVCVMRWTYQVVKVEIEALGWDARENRTFQHGYITMGMSREWRGNHEVFWKQINFSIIVFFSNQNSLLFGSLTLIYILRLKHYNKLMNL